MAPNDTIYIKCNILIQLMKFIDFVSNCFPSLFSFELLPRDPKNYSLAFFTFLFPPRNEPEENSRKIHYLMK